jgi:hypothetical protein
MGTPKTVDWERIEADYRAGVKSLRETAGAHGITEGAIRKRAKQHGWTRDLKDKVRAKADEPGLRVSELDEHAAAGFVYVIGLDAPQRYFKIGMARFFPARMDAHQCASPFDLFVACAYFVPNMRAEEQRLHRRFAEQRVRGEWFTLSAADLQEIAGRSLLLEVTV